MRLAMMALVVAGTSVLNGCGGGGTVTAGASDSPIQNVPPGSPPSLWLGDWSGTLRFDQQEGNSCAPPPAESAAISVSAQAQPDEATFEVAVAAAVPIHESAQKSVPTETGSEIKFGYYRNMGATIGTNYVWQLDLQPDGTMRVKYAEGRQASDSYCYRFWSGTATRVKT